MSYWFFFSYAHADQDIYLDKFYKDLAGEVRRLTGIAAPESGFIDRKDIEHGAAWEPRLEEGLRSCRVFIPIYTPSYFLSEYCGREFEMFQDRVYAKQGAPAPLILPVLWTKEKNVLSALPPIISNIHYTHGSYPSAYQAEGLVQLVRLANVSGDKYYNEYWDFVSKFADVIKDAGEEYPLPAINALRPLSSVQGLFKRSGSPALPNQSGTGPRYVQFIFVAGKQGELEAAQRKVLKYYGQRGGSDWLPYLDAYKGNVATLAIEAVKEVSKDLNYEEVSLSTRIDHQIKMAARDDKIVVVVVDTWTLRLLEYNDLVAPLDQYSSLNCITMILWNEEDQEAAVHRGALETAVQGTFNTKLALGEPNFFPNSIKSYESFKKELVKALVRAQAQIVETAQKKKLMDFAFVKTPQAAKFETKPSL